MTNFDLLMGGPAFLQGIGAGAFPFLQPAIEPHHPGLASEIIKGVQVNKMPNYFRSATGHYSFPGMYTVLLPLIPALYIKSSCLQLKNQQKMSNNYKVSDKRKAIAYWITTSLVILELLYGAAWDFNLLNKGFVAAVMAHLGYPSYLPLILGTSKLLAAICLVLPGLIILKEWAYSGLMILFLGAFCSHIIVGDGISSTMAFLSICIGLTITSYCLRPATRKIS